MKNSKLWIVSVLLLAISVCFAASVAFAASNEDGSMDTNSRNYLFHDYESEDALVSSDYVAYTMYLKSSSLNGNVNVAYDPASEEWAEIDSSYKLTNNYTTVIGANGVQFYRAADPKDAANSALMVCTRTTSGANDSTIDFTGDRVNSSNEYVVQFDYLLDYNYQTYTSRPVLFRVALNGADGTESILASATVFEGYSNIPFASSDATANAFKFNNVYFSSDTWYTFKLVWSKDSGTVSYYYSTDGGETFTAFGNTTTLQSDDALDTLRLKFPVYHVTAIQYLDNVSYKIPLASLKTFYDFDGDDALVTNNEIAYTMYLKNSALNGNVNVEYDPAGEEWASISDTYKLTNNYSTVIGANGVQFYQGVDPKDAANSALMVCTRTTSGANDSTVEFVGDAITSGSAYVAQFDYYLDYNKTANKPALNVNLVSEAGTAYNILKITPVLGYSADGSSGMAFNSTDVSENAFKFNGVYLNSDTWYTFRIILSENSLTYHYSTDGETFIQAGSAVTLSVTDAPTSLRFNFPVYAVNAIQYFDNVSFIKPVTAIKAIATVTVNGDDEEDDLADGDLDKLYNYFAGLITMKSSDVEISVGDTGLAISDSAYDKLSDYIAAEGYTDIDALKENGLAAYVIYEEDSEVAIAYTDLYARGAALNYIYDNRINDFSAYDGIIASEIFDIMEFITEHRIANQEASLNAYVDVFGEEAIDALLELYALYDEDLYIWLANLYDPAIGGFYYSNSARDNIGYLPDLESTAQALSLLDKAGLDGVYNDSIGDTLPDDIKLEIYNFALSLLADDGYYYHPQWGTNISNSRKGRDKGWGNDIIEAFGSVAENTATAGSYNYSSNIILTAKLNTSTKNAASKVVLASSVVLTSSTTFTDWDSLQAYIDANISNSYSLGNTLNANIGTIQNAGLRDELVAYLETLQYDNGLWEEEISYNSINGLMKMCGFWGGDYGTFPKATAALESLMTIILGDAADGLGEEELEEIETIAFVYNTWVIMYKLVGHLDDSERAEIAAELIDNSEALIGNVCTMFNIFKKADGGFSMEQECSSPTSQGVPVAVRGSAESDVNATGIAVSTLRYIIRVYQLYLDCEFEVPAIYCDYDRAYFLDILTSREAVEKVITPPEVVTFDGEYSEDMTEGGVILYPADSIVNNIGDTDLDDNENYKWFQSSIVANPTDAADMVLKAQTFTYSGESAAAMSNTEFRITNAAADGECYVFESDIYFGGGSGTVAQIFFATRTSASASQSECLNLSTYTSGGVTYLRLKEASYYLGTDSTASTLAEGIAVNEWFNLRLELYREYNDSGDTVTAMYIKAFVDGIYIGEAVSGRYSSSTGYHNYTIDTVRFSYYRSSASTFYFNNAYAAKLDKPYAEGCNTIGDVTVYDFESENALASTDNFEVNMYVKSTGLTNGAVVQYDPASDEWAAVDSSYKYTNDYTTVIGTYGAQYEIAADPQDCANKALKVYTNLSSYTSSNVNGINVSKEVLIDGGVYVLQFDYYLDYNYVANKNLMYIDFLDVDGLDYAITETISSLGYSTDSGDGMMLNSTVVTEDAYTLNDIYFDSDTWYTFRVIYYDSTLYYYYSTDGGYTFTEMESIEMEIEADVEYVSLYFPKRSSTSIQYLDNISFVEIDRFIAPTLVTE